MAPRRLAEAKPEPIVINKDVDLARGIPPVHRPQPDPGSDGRSSAPSATTSSQTVADALLRLVVENVNLGALARAAGLDLPSIIEQIPASLLNGVLGAIPINITGVLGDITGVLGPITSGLLTPLLALDAARDHRRQR